MAAMGDGGKTKLESVREWVVEHKLRTVGNFVYFIDSIMHLTWYLVVLVMELDFKHKNKNHLTFSFFILSIVKT